MALNKYEVDDTHVCNTHVCADVWGERGVGCKEFP